MAHKERVDVTLSKQIVYGNITHKLAEKLPNGHTHRWTIYLKPYNVEKLSNFVRKVQFKLHSDYENAVRVVEEEPFEITETGWGEFPIQIKIYFIDPNERQAVCSHYLALHQPEIIQDDGSTAVLKEIVDEIVFVNPTQKIYDIITDKSLVKPHDPSKWKFNCIDPQLLESQAKEIAQIATQSELEIKELTEAIRLVAKQCEEYREKLKDCESYDASEIKIEL